MKTLDTWPGIKHYEPRGAHMKVTEKSNMKRVMDWMNNNQGETMKKCQKDLGLSHVTVRKHMKKLNG